MSIGLIFPFIAVASFAAGMIYVAVSDVLTMTISDRLVLGLLAGFPVLAPLCGWSLEDMGFAFALALMTLFTSIALFALGWIGGGDGKLLTVTVLWLGGNQVLDFLIITSILGGLCTMLILLFRKCTPGAGLLRARWIARLHSPEAGVPYGVAIGAAALLVLPNTLWFDVAF